MKIIFEKEDYVEAITPYENGCTFRAIFDGEDTYLEFGCYCLIYLLTGANEQFARMLEANGNKPIKLNITPEIKMAMMEVKPCKHCDGTRHKPRKE